LTTAKAAGTAAIGRAVAHPYATTITAVRLGLAPILGPAGIIAMPLNALGFGVRGVAGGTLASFSASATWPTIANSCSCIGSVTAWYQGTAYGAYVPVGSVFAWLQHPGAVL
jgi:hypothetical protein